MTRSTKVAARLTTDKELAEWYASAKYEYVACREARHAWPIDRASMTWKADNHQGRPVWVRVWTCTHGCGVTRTWRRCRVSGENLGSTYEYPSSENGGRSDYLLPVGLGHLSSDDIFRLQMATQPTTRRARKG